MASVSRSAAGLRLVQFIGLDGKRYTVRLGKCPDYVAQEVRRRIEYILAAQAGGVSIDVETSTWLTKISDVLRKKLVRAHLAMPRAGAKLGAFLAAFQRKRTDVRLRTALNMAGSASRILKFFGEDRDMRTISDMDTENWLIWLRTEGYADATIGRDIIRARQFFKSAIKQGILTTNPFSSIKAPSQVNKDREYFIDLPTSRKIIEECPDWRWRLIFALSRFGGMRCPSDHVALRWEGVIWDKDRIHIDSPKSGSRVFPLFPELRPFLEEAWDQAPEGAKLVLPDVDGERNWRTHMQRIIARAGVSPWPRLFHNLRSSRQTELTNYYPAHVVCMWLGNTYEVAANHYLQVTDDHYKAAARYGASAAGSAAACGVQGPSGESAAGSTEPSM